VYEVEIMADNTTLNYYNLNAKEVTQKYEDINVNKLHQKLLELLPSKGKILELGCGSGRDAAFLLTHGYDIHITDGSQRMLDHALQLHSELKGRESFLQLPGRFPFKDNSFSGVYAIAVLMHFEIAEIKDILTEISRVLTQPGYFFFSIPLKRDDLQKDCVDRYGRKYLQMSKKAWIKMCENFGFSFSTSFTNDDADRKIQWCSLFFQI
jgi:ubiquinone/menaquinone biosynthesis C-methylase UbiE